MLIRRFAALLLIAVASAPPPARASSADVCALLMPFLQKAPDHFAEVRGTKTSENAWDAKSIPEADALNAKCSLTTYVKDRSDLDCVVKFDADKSADQDAFFRDAVNGFDFCLANLKFGDSVRRVSERSDSASMRTESVAWFKGLNVKYKQVAQFGGGVTKTEFKSPNSLQVKIELFFGEDKS